MKYSFTVAVFLILGINAFAQNSVFATPQKEKVYHPKLRHQRVKPEYSIFLPDSIPEGSGIVAWNNLLWTHNDSGSAKLYAISPETGKIISEYPLPGVKNTDFEDIAHDEQNFYIGATGNNAHEKDTVPIYRIPKQSLMNHKITIDSISVVWPETYTMNKKQKINFDCEAIIVVDDSIYLFTKEWKERRRTRVFAVPAVPGVHVAEYKGTLETPILITGATFEKQSNKLVLCGHTLLLAPVLLEFPDIRNREFFKGPGKRIRIKESFRQVEGIGSFDGKTYYIVNEKFKIGFIKSHQRLHRVRLSD